MVSAVLSLMELPVEAFCIFNNFFSSAFSHLMKIKNNVPGKKQATISFIFFHKIAIHQNQNHTKGGKE